MAEFIAFMRLIPELRKLLVAVGQLIEAGKEEDAATIVLNYRRGTAAGIAAHRESNLAGRKSK